MLDRLTRATTLSLSSQRSAGVSAVRRKIATGTTPGTAGSCVEFVGAGLVPARLADSVRSGAGRDKPGPYRHRRDVHVVLRPRRLLGGEERKRLARVVDDEVEAGRTGPAA